jgi:hypothetical protein
MAIYQWVGGHTGYTGTNSGWNGSTASSVWTSGIDGTTSSAGDFVFGPYFWGNTKNWKKVLSVTGSFGYLNYADTTTLPKGGDTVWFGGSYTGPSGQQTQTYSVSCLYGGMSGDGFTASGATAWAGGYTAGSGGHGNIAFTVYNTFRPTTHPSLRIRTGEIGVGANIYGDFSSFSPLKIRTSQFTFNDFSTSTTGGADIALHNIASSVGGFGLYKPSTYNDFTHGVAFLKGNWEYIYQNGGSVFVTDVTQSNGGYFAVYGHPVRFSASATTAIGEYNIYATSLLSGGYIWGNYGSQAIIRIGKYLGNAPITLGSLGDGGNPTYTELALGAWSATGAASPSPNIKLATCQIDYLKCEDAQIGVSELVTRFDYPIIRDGYMKAGTLDMSHPTDPSWANFLLAYAPGDNGLRFDSNDVVIKPYIGASLKTGAVEGLTG